MARKKIVEIEATENNTIKTKSTRKPKIKSIPQTYIEDTFDLDSNDNLIETIYVNNTIEKGKNYITKDDLLKNKQFQLKFNTLKAKIEFDKSFNTLLDFMNLSRIYKIFTIDDETDEIDILLYELVSYFKMRLTRIKLSYTDYNNVNIYFETIKTLYRRFNKANNVEKNELKKELDKALLMNDYIKRLLF